MGLKGNLFAKGSAKKRKAHIKYPCSLFTVGIHRKREFFFFGIGERKENVLHFIIFSVVLC